MRAGRSPRTREGPAPVTGPRVHQLIGNYGQRGAAGAVGALFEPFAACDQIRCWPKPGSAGQTGGWRGPSRLPPCLDGGEGSSPVTDDELC